MKPTIVLTGGIGTGKSYVATRLARRGIEVFDCDASAKRLMGSDPRLMADLTRLVGEDLYRGNLLDKAVMARFILESESNARAVSALVNPAVAADFRSSGLSWIESAIYWNNGFDRLVEADAVIVVYAPEPVRIARIISRDHVTEERARQWIARQMPQSDMVARATDLIVNDGEIDVDPQIDRCLARIES